MVDFSNIEKLDVGGRQRAELTLFQVDGAPTLTLAPALESNKPYFNAALKGARKHQRGTRGGGVKASTVSAVRDSNRRLFAKHIVKDWSGVVDADGNEVDFNLEHCEAFLNALPDWLFDEIVEFAGNPANFQVEEDDLDVEELEGN